MKISIHIFNWLLLLGLLLGSCQTQIQTNNSTATAFIEPKKIAVLDTLGSIHTLPHVNHKATNTPTIYTPQQQYEMAFTDLENMLIGKVEPNFERAVFMSENPYHHGQFTYKAFQNSITQQLQIIESLIKANDKSDSIDFNTYVNEHGRFKLADIRYLPHQKKELYRQALSNWAVFKYLTDTVFIHRFPFTYYHAPFTYATADPFGIKDWTNSQVINLLTSDENKGNCFALTALYKILSDRLQADARICTAPQHIYIQHKDPKGQYYNVELATAGHPGDGIIQTLTYTPSEAIMSGIALRDYTTKQSIGLCLVNLAKSYEHTFNTKDHAFLLRCAELALAHDSLNLNALLLKQQVLDARVTKYAAQQHLNSIAQLKQDKNIVPLVNALEKHTALLYQLGYREMPLTMQQQIMNPLAYNTKKWNHVSQNARPFTSLKVPDPKDEEYWTLTKGMFKEIWEPTAKETYGHYTLATATGKLKAIDTATSPNMLIDPVAFAYDFGARMYDARLGRWLSLDPLAAKYPQLSPYNFCNNNPVIYTDFDGRDFGYKIDHDKKTLIFVANVHTTSQEHYKQALAAAAMWNAKTAASGEYTVSFEVNVLKPSEQMTKTNGSNNRWHLGIREVMCDNLEVGNLYSGTDGPSNTTIYNSNEFIGGETVDGVAITMNSHETAGDLGSYPDLVSHEMGHLFGLDDDKPNVKYFGGNDGIMKYGGFKLNPISNCDVETIVKFAKDAIEGKTDESEAKVKLLEQKGKSDGSNPLGTKNE
jgi:RHS repeat-associated protein